MCFYSTNKKFTFHHVPRSLCIDTIEVICTSLLLWPVLCLIFPSLCISFLLWRTSILILSLLSALLLLLLGLFSWWLVLRSDLSLLLVAITLILHEGNPWSHGPLPYTWNKWPWPCDIGQFHDFYHNGHMHPGSEDSDIVLASCYVAVFQHCQLC